MSELRESDRGGGQIGPESFVDCSMPLQRLDLPNTDEVHAWYLDLGALGGSLRSALDDPGEISTTPLTLGQLRFARHFYLRLLLGAYLGIPGKSVVIRRSDKGKPELDTRVHDCNLHFSIAKSGDRALVGLSASGLVGVDLEPYGRRAHKPAAVARRYFNPSEADAIEAMMPENVDEAFLRTWACKEAVVKASGEGIANQLCRFGVETRLERPPAVLSFDGDDPTRWSLCMVRPEKSHLGALAARHSVKSVGAFRLRHQNADR